MNKTYVLGALFCALGLTSTLCAPETLCPNATTTRDTEKCLAAELQKAEKLLDRYLAEATRQASDNSDVRGSLDAAQTAWLKYKEAHCMSVYKVHAPGSAATLQLIGCKLDLVQKRTHELWDTYISNRATALSEPQP